MSNFVTDPVTLPFPKTDLTPVPTGQDDKYVSASDWNRVCQAAADLKAYVTAASGATPGSYTSADITINAQGKVLAAANGSGGGGVPTSRAINTGTGLSGGGNLTADRTISLANTTVTPGTYSVPTLVVDAQGRITGANTNVLATIATSGSADDLAAGHVPSTRMPALTGAVTTTIGTVATTISNHVVTAAMQSQVPAFTLRGNNTGSTADEINVTVAQAVTMLGLGPSKAGQYGTGSDGTVTFDGINPVDGYSGPVGSSPAVYTATREANYVSATINTGVKVNQHSHPGPNVQVLLTNNGDLSWAGASASGGPSGGQSFAVTGPLPVGTSGGDGSLSNVNGNNGTGVTNAPRGFSTTFAGGSVGGFPAGPATAGGIGHGGGGGGSLANGGNGGSISLLAATGGDSQNILIAMTATSIANSSGTFAKLGTATGGGGGAGGGTGSVGGGAGAGGSWAALRVFKFAGSGTYSCGGGGGANGTGPTGGVNQTGGGGGGGGGGGYVALLTADPTPPTFNVGGGAAGSGTPGNGTGQSGTNGAAGGSGIVLVFS